MARNFSDDSWHLAEKATQDFPMDGYRIPADIADTVMSIFAVLWLALAMLRGTSGGMNICSGLGSDQLAV